MRVATRPARHGALWLAAGWSLYRRRPFEISWMVLLYFLLLMGTLGAAAIDPTLGTLLRFAYAILLPGLSVGFFAAARQTELGRPIAPFLLFRPFSAQDSGRFALLIVGLLQLALVLLLSALASYVAFGSIAPEFKGFADPQNLTPAEFEVLEKFTAVLAVTVVGSWLPFWYAPALVSWHRIPPIKAVFFSVAAVWRNRAAFLVFLFCCATMPVFVTLMVMSFLDLIGLPTAALASMFPLSVILVGILQCAYYASYRGVFEEPPQAGSAAGD